MRAGKHHSEARTGEGTWTAPQLRAYLVEMSYNTWQDDLCLPEQEFPKRIRLDRHFQEPFAMMRQETVRDQRERWRFIGITKDRNRIKLSLPVVLTDNQRMMRDDMLYTQWLAEQNGIPHVVGDVQTRLDERDTQSPRASITDQPENGFTAHDLYYLLLSRSSLPVRIVLTPTDNHIVFRSQESELATYAPNAEDFARYWASQNSDSKRITRAIAQRHSLALYRGKPEQPLTRISPEVRESP